MRILLVEDDESSAKVLQSVLTEARYAVDVALDGQTGWQLLRASSYDLILLDVVLPKTNGLDFCRRLRDSACDSPVLLVTSLNSSQEKVAGLNAGADDYITKPFEVEELLARVRAVSRRIGTAVVSQLKWDELCLRPDSCEVTYGPVILALTPKEYSLLELFLRNPTQVFSRSAILDRLWSCSDAPGEETVTSHIKGLRKKLVDAGAPEDLVQTVYGVGYRLKPLPNEKRPDGKRPDGKKREAGNATDTLTQKMTIQKATDRQSRKISDELPADYHQKIQAAIATLWKSAKYQQLDLLAQLRQAEKILRSRQLSSEEQHNAYIAAHRMHGALGIFGFPEGSHIAGEIQQMIKDTVPSSLTEKTRFKALLDALKDSIH